MDNQEEILSAEEHFGEGNPQTNQPQQKPKKRKIKQNAIIQEKEKLTSDVDHLLYKITDSNEERKDLSELPEYISVNVEMLHELLDCHLCKDVPRKVKTIKYCLHRFCDECIDQWLKLGNKVCPVCKTKCPSQEALVDDHTRDKLVAICFPHTQDHEAQDEDMQLMDDKSIQYQGNKPEHGVKSTPHSSMSQSISATPEASFFPSDEMLDHVVKQVATAIIKHEKREAQQPPNIDSRE